MIERHTFKELVKSIMILEDGIKGVEKLFNQHLDDCWLLEAERHIIHAIAEGFQSEAINDSQVNIIEELLYHFFFMEEFGNDSEHCRSKLVVVNEGKEDEHCISCTTLDELYNVICTYLECTHCDFTFNYCHSYHLDEELKDET